MQQRKLYIKTFGCQMNERDSEIIEQLLYPAGFIPYDDIETADLVILNTCSVRAKAEQKVCSRKMDHKSKFSKEYEVVHGQGSWHNFLNEFNDTIDGRVDWMREMID